LTFIQVFDGPDSCHIAGNRKSRRLPQRCGSRFRPVSGERAGQLPLKRPDNYGATTLLESPWRAIPLGLIVTRKLSMSDFRTGNPGGFVAVDGHGCLAGLAFNAGG